MYKTIFKPLLDFTVALIGIPKHFTTLKEDTSN